MVGELNKLVSEDEEMTSRFVHDLVEDAPAVEADGWVMSRQATKYPLLPSGMYIKRDPKSGLRQR